MDGAQTPLADTLREPSRRAILIEIRKRGAIARIDLSDALGLSPATVTAATADLIDAGLIEEVERPAGDAPARRGRPPVLLSLKGEALYFAGAKVSDRSITVVVLDFLGEIRGEREVAVVTAGMPVDGIVGALSEALDQVLAETGLSRDVVSGIGVGVPGFIDQPAGLVHWSPLFSAPPDAFYKGLAAAMPFPAFIDNDANLACLAELRAGYGRGEEHFVTVTIEHGVGLGIVVGGQLFRGARGIGAEFGHTKVQYDGALCRCGQRGCLEAYVADYALLREATVAMGDEWRPRGQSIDQSLSDLQAAAQAGHTGAGMIFDRAARMLGLGIANLVNLLDPPLVILSGERMRQDILFAEAMQAALRENLLHIDRPAPDVKIHRWGSLLWAQGGAILAQDEWMFRHAAL